MTNADTTALEKRMLNSQQRYILPDGARDLLLVRHGATGGEKVDTLLFGELTLSNPDLLPEGQAQARAVAERLRTAPIAQIFVTNLKRTAQTAAPLVELTGIEPIVIPELREAHLGDWEHEFYARAAAGDPLLKRMLAEENWDIIPNAETMAAFAARVKMGIEQIVASIDPGTTAVAFVHGGTIGEACRQATGSRPFAFFSPENTSISRLVIAGDGRWSLRSFNDVAHLADM